jgi:hypothetical protein
MTKMNGGHVPAPESEPDLGSAAHVGVEIVPVPGPLGIAGAGLSMASGEGDNEVRLTASLSGAQAREIAARLLTLADAASAGAERTVMVVTKTSAWLPGQHLIIRSTPDGFHYQFALGSKLAVPEKPKLIIAR